MKAIIRNVKTQVEIKIWVENSRFFMQGQNGICEAECKGTLDDAIELFTFDAHKDIEVIKVKD